jgi:hypothetical protein
VKKITNVAATLAVAFLVVGALMTTTTALARSQQKCLLIGTMCKGDVCSSTKKVTIEVGSQQKYTVTLEGQSYLLAEQRCEQGPSKGKFALKYTAPGGSMAVVDIDARTNTRRVVIRGTEGATERHVFDYCGKPSQRAVFTVTRPEVIPEPEPVPPTEDELEAAAEERIDKLVRELESAKKELKGLVREKRRKKEAQIRRLEDALKDARAELKEAEAREKEIEQQLAPPPAPDDGSSSKKATNAKTAAVRGGFVGGGGSNDAFGAEAVALWHVVPTDGNANKHGFSLGAGYRWVRMEKFVAEVTDLYIESNNHMGFMVLAYHAQPNDWFNFFASAILGGGTDYQGPGDGRNPQHEGFFMPGIDLDFCFAPVHWLNLYVGGTATTFLGARSAIAPADEVDSVYQFYGRIGALATF